MQKIEDFNFELHNEKILKILNEKCRQPCPACGIRIGKSFVPGYFVHTVQEKPLGIDLGGKTVTYVATACRNCGFMQNHLLKLLVPDIKFDE